MRRTEVPEYPLNTRTFCPDTLDDVVPSEKYRAEFGDGPVPVTHAEHLYWRVGNDTDQWQALIDTAAIYDRGRELFGKVDAQHVASLLRAYRHYHKTIVEKDHNRGRWEEVVAEPDPDHETEGQRIVRDLARSGLRIAPLRKMVKDYDLYECFPAWKGRPMSLWAAVDDCVLAGDNYTDVAARFGVSPNLTKAWALARGYDLEAAMTEATYWWIAQADESVGRPDRVALIEAMSARYPWCNFDQSSLCRRVRKINEGQAPAIERNPAWTNPW